MNPICANCEEIISGEPYETDGQVFCCFGCAGGGPCQCTYIPDPASRMAAPATPASEAPAPRAASAGARPREAQPLAWPAPCRGEQPARRRPSILRVAGLTTQHDLLRLGLALEQQPEVEDLALVRADLDDAWFAVAVRDPDALADALVRVEEYEVDARPHPAGVDATLVARRMDGVAEPAPERAAPEVRSGEERPRFRLFRRDEPERSEAPRYAERADASEPVAAYPSVPAPAPAPFPSGVPAVTALPARVPEPAPALLTAESRPGGAVTMREHITLVAYPFRSFVALNDFQDALRALHGVVNVKVRRFYRGTLHLGVEYEDVLPLTERLRDLEGFAWRLVSSTPQEVELMLEEQGDLVSSG